MSDNHDHPPSSTGRAFATAMTIQAAFIGVEVIVGLKARSLAVLADAGHNVSDALALALAWGGILLAKRQATKGRTYGWKSATILAAVINMATLLFVNGAIAWEAMSRLRRPDPVAAVPMIIVSLAGVLVNGLCAWLVARDSAKDLNVRAAFVHLASDATVAGAVALTGVAIRLTGFAVLDPLVSILVAGVVLWSTWPLLRTAVDLALHAVPRGVDEDAVREELLSAPGVVDVHDLHVWALSTTETALTAHVVSTTPSDDARLRAVTNKLRAAFAIQHVTLQVEGRTSAPPSVSPNRSPACGGCTT